MGLHVFPIPIPPPTSLSTIPMLLFILLHYILLLSNVCCTNIPQIVFSSEKAMVAHSSILAWKITWTEEPGGLQSMGSLRVGHD